jgi:hypothetical protein
VCDWQTWAAAAIQLAWSNRELCDVDNRRGRGRVVCCRQAVLSTSTAGEWCIQIFKSCSRYATVLASLCCKVSVSQGESLHDGTLEHTGHSVLANSTGLCSICAICNKVTDYFTISIQKLRYTCAACALRLVSAVVLASLVLSAVPTRHPPPHHPADSFYTSSPVTSFGPHGTIAPFARPRGPWSPMPFADVPPIAPTCTEPGAPPPSPTLPSPISHALWHHPAPPPFCRYALPSRPRAFRTVPPSDIALCPLWVPSCRPVCLRGRLSRSRCRRKQP